MQKFVWTEEYSVGIKVIDEQHRHFFEIADKIIDLTARENLTKEEVFSALEELGNYAFYHFSTEEGYFAKFGYEAAPLHVESHNEYREAIGKYFENIRKEKTDFKKLAEEMVWYSSNWLSRHILVMDKQYTKFFKEKGID